MKTLYLECAMGAAGDMLAAALYELCTPAQRQAFLAGMQKPLCLPLNTAWRWLEKANASDTAQQWQLGDAAQQQQAREDALKTYQGDGFYVIGEVENVYWSRSFPELADSDWDELEGYAQTLLLPLYQQLTEIDV